MSIVFFSIAPKAIALKDSALRGLYAGVGTGVAYNLYRNSVHPYTSAEREAIQAYKEADKNYGFTERIRDALPKLNYTEDGEAYVKAKGLRDAAVEQRRKRVNPFNLRTAATIGALGGLAYGVKKLL